MEMVMESIKSARGVLMLTDSEGKPRHTVTKGKDVFFSEDVVRQVIQRPKIPAGGLRPGCFQDHGVARRPVSHLRPLAQGP